MVDQSQHPKTLHAHTMSKSKITTEAKARCAAHTLQEQLDQLRAIHAVEVAILNKRQSHDMHDVEQMLEGDDTSWSGQHARLALPLEGCD
jgi:hypothetical protein